jgi:hypothetical protein
VRFTGSSFIGDRYHAVPGNHQAERVDLRFVSINILSTLSQLKHSNVRASKSRRAVLTWVSTIGARHFVQG